MIYFILYVVSVFIAIPVIGRFFEANRPVRKSGEFGNVTLGIGYGWMWPVFVIMLVVLLAWDCRPKTGLIRKYVTGE